MKMIKAGIIGYNEGNGHPFSFAAITNGYVDSDALWGKYPQILNYLRSRDETEFGVDGLSITHVWTQDLNISREIAECSRIENVLEDPMDFVGAVDFLIIATDEGEKHRDISSPFLEAGMMVFIDKPLCTNIEDLKYFLPYLQNGQLQSCSGFRFHPELEKHISVSQNREEAVLSVAYTKFDWFKYGIHLLEPILAFHQSEIVDFKKLSSGSDREVIQLTFSNGDTSILIRDPRTNAFRFDIHWKQGRGEIIFNDNFTYFKNLLIGLVSFYNGNPVYTWQETQKAIELLIKIHQNESK